MEVFGYAGQALGFVGAFLDERTQRTGSLEQLGGCDRLSDGRRCFA
jgi:hypothetical protein